MNTLPEEVMQAIEQFVPFEPELLTDEEVIDELYYRFQLNGRDRTYDELIHDISERQYVRILPLMNMRERDRLFRYLMRQREKKALFILKLVNHSMEESVKPSDKEIAIDHILQGEYQLAYRALNLV